MGLLLQLITIAVLFLVVFFQRTVFVSDELPPKPSDHESFNDVDINVSTSPKSDDLTLPVPASHIPDAAEDDPGFSVAVSANVEPQPPNTRTHIPHYHINFTASAFHPPMIDEFWTTLLHQRNYSGPLENGRPPSANATTSKEGTKADEDMLSFDEWRQQKLKIVEQEKSDLSGVTNGNGKRRQRPMKNTNYASMVCGAKVQAYNPEVENPTAILTSNRDEYMLNPCKANRKYFVVELCESIHVYGFEIGNLELFSNVPKTIHVSGSGRFPARDWVDLGRYDMKELRAIQNFSVIHASGYLKYVRVEILEYYGTEHYCPITLFRVFGSSMVEEYVDSVADDDDDDDDNTPGKERQMNEDVYMERDKWSSDVFETVNPIVMAKDLVMSFVKKAASSGYSLLNGVGKKSSPVAPCRNATSLMTLQSNANTASHDTLHSASISPGSPLLGLCFNKSEGWNVSSSTCQYVWCLLQACNATLSFCPGSWKPKTHRQEFVPPPPTAHPTSCDEPILSAEPTKVPPAGPVPVVKEVPNVYVPVTPTLPLETPNSSVTESVKLDAVPVGKDSSLVLDAAPVLQGQEVENKTAVPVLNGQYTEPINLNSVVNNTPGQKESVFVRLGNRIKTLELNMSLSGQYLHELSRRFKKQGEESAKNFTLMFTKNAENAKFVAERHADLVIQVDELETKNHILETELIAINTYMRMLIWLLPVVCLSVFIIFAAVGLYVFRRYVKRKIAKELLELMRRSERNGFVNGSVKHASPGGEMITRKPHKVKKRNKLGAETPQRQVPG